MACGGRCFGAIIVASSGTTLLLTSLNGIKMSCIWIWSHDNNTIVHDKSTQWVGVSIGISLAESKQTSDQRRAVINTDTWFLVQLSSLVFRRDHSWKYAVAHCTTTSLVGPTDIGEQRLYVVQFDAALHNRDTELKMMHQLIYRLIWRSHRRNEPVFRVNLHLRDPPPAHRSVTNPLCPPFLAPFCPLRRDD